MVMRMFAVFLTVMAVLALGAAPALAAAEPDQALTQQELEILLEESGFGFNNDYTGPLPSRAQVEADIARLAAALANVATMPVPFAVEEQADGGSSATSAIEYHRVCSAYTPGLTGRVRFQFWLESDGEKFTDINRFKAKFIPAPTLPTIGGIDMESIEGIITNKYNYSSANGKKWVGAANVTIILTYFEYLEYVIYAHVLCSVKHP